MFGHIKGVKPGQIFKDSKALAAAGIHKQLQAGIWGGQTGAVSIVLSGGYEDDIDEMDYVYYTGQGGRDAKTGRQIADQRFDAGNKGLQLSCDYNLPVRVTRGFQIPNGPPTGYRYDGLYYVQSYERVPGKGGFLICRFHLISEASLSSIEDSAGENFKTTYQRTNRTEITVNRLNRNIKISERVKE